MKFEEYTKAFWAGVAGAVIAFMMWLQNPEMDPRILAVAVGGGFATGFLSAFLPANKVNGVNAQAEAKQASLTPPGR